jgi:polysaccharide pyruvyl transferase WcaK-like protein
MNSGPPAAGSRTSPGFTRRPRIAILAINAGNTNLGDEAVLESAVAGIRSRLANPAISVLSVNPPGSDAQDDLRAVPIRVGSLGIRLAASPKHHEHATRRGGPLGIARRRLLRLWRLTIAAALQPIHVLRLTGQLHGTDLLVLAGSNQLEDSSGGAWGYPFIILLCCILARVNGARIAFVSVGAGPLGSPVSRTFCTFALRLATYVSFRDQGSLDLIRRMGYRGDARVVPDLAYALELPARVDVRSFSPRTVAVNVFPFHDPRYEANVADGGKGFERYVDALAQFVVGVRSRGMDVVLFGTQRADEVVLESVGERIRLRAPGLGAITRLMPASYPELKSIIAGSDAVVATRYHGILLATMHGRPTIGVCYQPKSRRLLEMAGIENFGISADRVGPDDLLERLSVALEDGGLAERIRSRASELHEECRRGIDDALERTIPRLVVASRA